MTSVELEHIDFIVDEVKSLWLNESEPYYLNRLGVEFRKKFNTTIKDLYGKKMQDLITQNISDKICVVTHPELSQYVAAAPIENKEEALNFIIKSNQNRPATENRKETKSEELDFDRVQNSIVFAFQQSVNDGEFVFIKISRPIHFVKAKENPNDLLYTLIDQEFYLPQTPPLKASDLPREVYLRLKENVTQWLRKNHIAYSRVYFDGANYDKRESGISTQIFEKNSPNALTRLMLSQSEELRHRIFIPLDIAELLSRHK